jgi:hypothetical protein
MEKRGEGGREEERRGEKIVLNARGRDNRRGMRRRMYNSDRRG